jgi:hypothetical protein
MSLAGSSKARADDSNSITMVGMGDDQKPASVGHSNCEESLLFAGMIRIMVCQSQGITEDGRGFMERNAMLPAILRL